MIYFLYAFLLTEKYTKIEKYKIKLNLYILTFIDLYVYMYAYSTYPHKCYF